MGDIGRSFLQQRTSLCDQRIKLKYSFARHGTDPQALTVLAHILQLLDTVQVDQHGGLHHTKIHRWHQALTSRKDLGFIRMFMHEFQRLINGIRNVIFKRSWFHEFLKMAEIRDQ
jgi:hypothetical protein